MQNVVMESTTNPGNAAGGSFTNELFSCPGMIYKHRVQSFEENNWPWNNSRQCKCTPHTLAMAGLIYAGKKYAAKCFLCNVCIENFKKSSDPWKRHSTKNKDCLYIRLGKRASPTDYTMGEIIDLYKARAVQIYADEYLAKQRELYNNLQAMAKLEKDASKLDKDASKLDNDASKLEKNASKLEKDASKLKNDASKLEKDTSKLEKNAQKLKK